VRKVNTMHFCKIST